MELTKRSADAVEGPRTVRKCGNSDDGIDELTDWISSGIPNLYAAAGVQTPQRTLALQGLNAKEARTGVLRYEPPENRGPTRSAWLLFRCAGHRQNRIPQPRLSSWRLNHLARRGRLVGASTTEEPSSNAGLNYAFRAPKSQCCQAPTDRQGKFAAIGCSHSTGGSSSTAISSTSPTCGPTAPRLRRTSSFRVDGSIARRTLAGSIRQSPTQSERQQPVFCC